MNKEDIRRVDELFLALFTDKFNFSHNIIKYEDDVVFDMHDHNFFMFSRNVSLRELFDAQAYQYKKKKDFLKFISFNKLDKRLVKRMGLEESTTLTMLYKGDKSELTINEKIEIKNVKLNELNDIELKHYKRIYGEGFILRRNKAYFKESKKNKDFCFYGAYIKDKLVGYCYCFTCGRYTCIDSLLVDYLYRRKHVASTLLHYVASHYDLVMLHADDDDYPKEIYMKYGFKTVDKSYEYFKPLHKIGDEINAVIDRPLGSMHPEGKNIYYEINYGYVKGLMAPDMEEQDVYVLDIDKPCKRAKGKLIAILHRTDDYEDKWVISSKRHSLKDIEKLVYFQEKYHKHYIIM